MNITVIYNPSSGKNNNLDEIKAAFANHGVQPTYLPITSKLLHRHIKGELAKRGAVVVAAGGDGTVNGVAALVQGTKLKFGVIPSGTLNHFAKDIGLPLDAGEAVKVILNGNTKQIDAAMVNKQLFINNSSIGLYPQSLRTRARFDGQIGKWPAAMLGMAKVLARPRRFRVQLHIDGKELTRRTPFVFIGNNPYDFRKPPFIRREAINKGMLGVHIIKASSAFGVIRMFAHTLFTKKRHTAEFEVHTVPAFTIATKHHRTLHVAYDGEVTQFRTPLHYTSLPGALRVIVP